MTEGSGFKCHLEEVLISLCSFLPSAHMVQICEKSCELDIYSLRLGVVVIYVQEHFLRAVSSIAAKLACSDCLWNLKARHQISNDLSASLTLQFVIHICNTPSFLQEYAAITSLWFVVSKKIQA